MLKVTKVITRHQQLQKMGQSSVSSFFDRRGKKALVEALEVGPHSEPYLIVKFKSKGDVIKSQDFSHEFYIIFLKLLKFLIGLRKDKRKNGLRKILLYLLDKKIRLLLLLLNKKAGSKSSRLYKKAKSKATFTGARRRPA